MITGNLRAISRQARPVANHASCMNARSQIGLLAMNSRLVLNILANRQRVIALTVVKQMFTVS